MIDLPWADFENLVITTKNLPLYYLETTSVYDIWAADVGSIVWHTRVLKDGGANQTDFETNYQSLANQSASPYSFKESALVYGRKVVTTAGTSVLIINGTTQTDALIIKALFDNDGDVYVGDSSVDSTNGFPLSPGESVSITIDNEKDNVYIDSDNNGDGVAYIGGFY